MRSYSARVIVCLVALVESSTMNVDLVLRESTLAFTATLPNSVITAFGIFSASSRSRAVVGFHSTVAAFTSCATAPPPGRASGTLHARACLPQRTVMCGLRCEIRGVYPGTTPVNCRRSGTFLSWSRAARSGHGRRERTGTDRQARQGAFSGRHESPARQGTEKATFGRHVTMSAAFLALWFRPLV